MGIPKQKDKKYEEHTEKEKELIKEIVIARIKQIPEKYKICIG